jgi:hypothetical protein
VLDPKLVRAPGHDEVDKILDGLGAVIEAWCGKG